MAQHKYAVGQTVRYTPDRTIDPSARGLYTIVRTLPENGGIWQYRIKARIDGRERIVPENLLYRATT